MVIIFKLAIRIDHTDSFSAYMRSDKTYTHTHTQIHTHTHAHIHLHTHTHTCTHMHADTNACTLVCTEGH